MNINKIIEYLKNELARNKPKKKDHNPIQYRKDIKVLNYLIARSKQDDEKTGYR
jgi:hypothetical protein